MASKETINIDIKSTAETAAVDKATAAVTKLNGTITAASSPGGGLKNLGNFATQAGYQVTDFAVQVQGGTSAVTALSQQLPQLLGAFQQCGVGAGGLANALGAAVSGGTALSLVATELIIGLKLAYDAFKEMQSAVKDADNAVVNFGKNLVTAGEHRVEQAKEFRDDIEKQLDADTEAAKRFNAASGRQDKLADANASLAAAQTKAGGAGNGTQAVQELDTQAKDFARAVKEAEAVVTQALDAQRLRAAAAANFPDGSSSAELEKAQKAKQAAEAAVAEAKADLENLKAVNTARIQEAAIGATATVTAAAESALTKQATDLKQQLETIQAREGAATSAAVLQSLQAVNQILADGKVTMGEANLLGSAFLSFRQSYEAATQIQQKNTTDLIAAVRNTDATARAQAREISEILIRQSGQ